MVSIFSSNFRREKQIAVYRKWNYSFERKQANTHTAAVVLVKNSLLVTGVILAMAEGDYGVLGDGLDPAAVQ